MFSKFRPIKPTYNSPGDADQGDRPDKQTHNTPHGRIVDSTDRSKHIQKLPNPTKYLNYFELNSLFLRVFFLCAVNGTERHHQQPASAHSAKMKPNKSKLEHFVRRYR